MAASAEQRHDDKGIRLIELALALHRNPTYAAALKPASELPQGMEFLLRMANGDDASLALAMRETGAPEQELKQAAIRFIEQVSFGPGDDPYRVLGLNPLAPLEEVKEHYRLLIRLFHPDRGIADHAAAEEYAARINHSFSAIRKQSAATAAERNDRSGVSSQPGPQNARQPGVSRTPVRFRAPPAAAPRLDALLPVRLTPLRVWGVIAVAAVLFVGAVYLANRGSVPDTEDAATMTAAESTAVEKPAPYPSGNVQGSRPDRLLQAAEPPPHAPAPLPQPQATERAGRAPTSQTDTGHAGPQQKTEAADRPAPGVQPAKAASPAVAAAPPVPVDPRPDSMKRESTSNFVANGGGAEAAAGASQKQLAEEKVPAAASSPGSFMPAAGAGQTEPTDDELHHVVSQFIGSYNHGDLDSFMSLIDDNIRTDEPGGKEGLRDAYGRLFGKSVAREMLLKNLHWQRNGGLAVGLTDYRVTVSRRGEDAPRIYTGSLRIEVARLEGRAMISGFYNQVDRK